MKDFEELVLKNRSYRRFIESHRITRETLERLVNLARLSASAANRQPLRYLLFNEPEDCGRIFPKTAWAGYLKEWEGPQQGERPSAYIIIVGDKTVTEGFGVDPGIAAQSIMLGATSMGLGGCMIASLRKDELRREFSVPERYEILLVLALGKPVERVIIEDIKDGDIKYWRDENGDHHVPKRKLDELIIKL